MRMYRDLFTVFCIIFMIWLTDINKETIKAFITGGVFSAWIMIKIR